jgi:hypothetical protein
LATLDRLLSAALAGPLCSSADSWTVAKPTATVRTAPACERERDTTIGEDSVAFFCIAKEAAERGSVFLQAGHSCVGLPDRACMSEQIGTPHGYDNRSCLAAKATTLDPERTRNADIITNGIAGSFGSMTDFTSTGDDFAHQRDVAPEQQMG